MGKSKILILCNDFYPDSIIGSKRLSLFTFYLSKYYDITIIRSGNIVGRPSLHLNLHNNKNVSILSFNGTNSTANLIEEGKISCTSIKKLHSTEVSKIKVLLYRFLKGFIFFKQNLVIKKRTISLIKDLMKQNTYDLVISTYSPLGSTAAGYFCKKKYKMKWIMDIRDIMDIPSRGFMVRTVNHILQKKYANIADAITTPTNGFKEELKKKTGTSKDIQVLYNGYDSTLSFLNRTEHKINKETLTFCYTGTIHDDLCTLSVFAKCIDELIDEKKIDGNRISISYAGSNSALFLNQIKPIQNKTIIKDYGYLNSEETFRLQEDSDVFLLMVMNQRKYTGVLTGKLAEGIQHNACILGMVFGDLPNSELFNLINNHSLGFCYEDVNKESFEKMKKFILMLYNKKINESNDSLIQYDCNKIAKEFDYEHISENLHLIVSKVLNQSKEK